ncbi:unnamed protein product, partial [Thlaspi arvense]
MAKKKKPPILGSPIGSRERSQSRLPPKPLPSSSAAPHPDLQTESQNSRNSDRNSNQATPQCPNVLVSTPQVHSPAVSGSSNTVVLDSAEMPPADPRQNPEGSASSSKPTWAEVSQKVPPPKSEVAKRKNYKATRRPSEEDAPLPQILRVESKNEGTIGRQKVSEEGCAWRAKSSSRKSMPSSSSSQKTEASSSANEDSNEDTSRGESSYYSEEDDNPEEFVVTFVYAVNCRYGRRELWLELTQLAADPCISAYPWTVLGDFNQSLNPEDDSLCQTFLPAASISSLIFLEGHPVL